MSSTRKRLGSPRILGRTAGLALGVILPALAGLAAAGGATSTPSRFSLANRCFALASASSGRFVEAVADGYRAGPRREGSGAAFYMKPTRLGDYMLYDQGRRLLATRSGAVERSTDPGPAAEWAPSRRSRGSFRIHSTADRRLLAVEPSTGRLVLAAPGSSGPRVRFAFIEARGCKRFPEARVGARGRPLAGIGPAGRVRGFADYHLHITADMRAGGQTIYGRNFAPFGIAQALGQDAAVHGPDGSLDITGNLLRTGSPAGTHDTQGWPSFTGWPVNDTYTHQQTYYVWLQRAWAAGERLVVAQTVEDEPLCRLEQLRSHSCDEMQTIELEIRRLRALQRYVDAQSGGPGRGWFRIVRSPHQARRVIGKGKLAVVIGMEASDPFGCSEVGGVAQCNRADIDRGLRELRRMGLRSMFIAHWVDNGFAGAALEPGDKGSFIAAMQAEETGQPFSTEPCPGPDEADRECNVKGLTPLGRYLVRRLIATHTLIDVDHLSQRARSAVMDIAVARHYPLVSSHTGTGGEWTPAQLRRLYRLGGLATATLATAPELARKIDTLERFRDRGHYFGVGIGSDTGGFNALPGPRPDAASHPLRYPFRAAYCHLTFTRQRTGTRTFDLNTDGVADYGLLADLLADTRHQPGGHRATRILFRSAEAYLRMWERTRAAH